MTAALRSRAALSGALVLTLLLAAPSCDEQTPPAAPVVPAPTPPPAPEPLAVPTGLRAVPVRMSGTVRWEWDPVAGAGWYQVQLSTDEVFADEDTITTAEVRDRPYYARAALADATTYYLRVRALAGSRADPMTSAWSGVSRRPRWTPTSCLRRAAFVSSTGARISLSGSGTTSPARAGTTSSSARPERSAPRTKSSPEAPGTTSTSGKGSSPAPPTTSACGPPPNARACGSRAPGLLG